METVRDDGLMAEINITPFTDVLLVLLIIFMILAALVAPPGFEKRLRGGGESMSPPVSRALEIVVTDRDAVLVSGRRTNLARIYDELDGVARRRGNVHVALRADVRASYGMVIRVLDAARRAGLDDVGFVTF